MHFNADVDTATRVNVDTNLINFKSSPNFKNMKKFLKKRTGNGADCTLTDSPENTMQQDESQPPLPVEPPPFDEIPTFKIHSSSSEDFDDQIVLLTTPKKEYTTPEPETINEDLSDCSSKYTKPLAKKDVTMCKDWLRQKCNREDCKYLHEIIKDQLEGVFKFCHNFQNQVCLKPNCKYVHCDFFEEQKFKRTGELPKVLRKKPITPTAPQTSEEEGNKDLSGTFVVNVSKPPPQIVSKPEKQVLSTPANTNVDPKSPRSSTKRSWSESKEGVSENITCTTLQDESRAKRINEGQCGSCKVLDNRLKFAVDRLKEIRKSSDESEMKLLNLERKHKFLLQLAALFSGRLNDRDSNVNSNQGSMFSQTHIQQISSITSVTYKDDQKKISPQHASSLTSQLKHLMQPPSKTSIPEESGAKVLQPYQMRMMLSV